MGIADQIAGDWHAALAALAWQVDLGVDEAIGDEPVDRYALPEKERPASAARPAAPPASLMPGPDAVPDVAQVDAPAVARTAAAAATSLAALHEALAAFDLCELKKGARNTVFADGNPAARVLVLGEPPGREEDVEGRPFVGAAGLMLDRMFAAIGLSRSSPDPSAALYVTPVMPWRPPGDLDPEPAEIAMIRPFLDRHIALVDPDVIVTMGNSPLQALTGQKGLMRARGTWGEALGRPLLPMLHPSYLLKNPLMKREAWADLLALQARLRQS